MSEFMTAFAATGNVEKPRPGYRYYVGDLRTGKIARSIDLVGGSWSTNIADTGSLEGSFPLRSGEWTTARADAAPAKSFLAAAYVKAAGDETFLAGGPIWKSTYTDSTGILRIGAAALSSYFDHRKVMPVLAPGDNPATQTVTYTGAQLGLIAKRLVELSQSHTAGQLPIVLPDDADLGGPGTTHTRTYPGYELGWVGERLQQLSEVQGGPEVQFIPRRRTDDPRFIEWVMRIGVAPTMVLAQAGPAWVFDRTVPKSPVKEISVDTDGTGMGFRAWAAGQGEAEGRPIVVTDDTTLTDAGWPLLELEASATDTVITTDTLTDYTTLSLAGGARPRETWTLTVDRDSRPDVGRYAAGDWATVRVGDHDYLNPGDYDMRILSIGGNDSATVTIGLDTRLGEV